MVKGEEFLNRNQPKRTVKLHDISLPIHSATPHWPGKTPPVLTATRSLSRGDICTCHSLSMDIHFGTHADAPAHFVANGMTVDELPLSVTCGPCRVVEFLAPDRAEIPASIMNDPPAERVLFKTLNSKLLGQREFQVEFVALSEELAALLVRNGVKLVGVDYFSVDRFTRQERTIHRILLGAGVVILEGLDLSAVGAGNYQLIAMPLKIVGAEGSPIRAVLVE